MAQAFIGEIRFFGGNFAPKNWAFCQGQILPIAQNTALFSILGTTYGGNGQTTFGLPDFRGRVPVGWGQGPGLTDRVLGEVAGEPGVSLTTNEVPAHTHSFMASSDRPANTNPLPPGGSVLARPNSGVYGTTTTPVQMAANAIALAGNSAPHTNMQPYLCIPFIICLFGVFPSRN